jgi:Tfp pilus assembly protein PilV
MNRQRHANRRSGMTLVEIMIAAFLLVLVGLVTWALLKNAINATAHGSLQIKIQENARNLMNTLGSEMKQASRPPKIGTSPQYTSGVLYPPTSLADTGTQQRVIFAEMSGLGTAGTTNYQTNINTYRIIEYRALPNDAANRARIVRSVWSASSSNASYISTGILGLSYVNPDFNFTLTPFDTGGTTPLSSEIVLELPFPNDTISLFVSHSPINGSTTKFEDRIFNVRLTLMQTLNNSLTRKKDHVVETIVYVR